MAKTELLTEFQRLLDEIEKLQGFIDKAQGQAGKFSPEVVEKVIKTNKQKIAEVSEAIGPKAEEVDAYITSLVAERQKEHSGAQQSELSLQELQLRKEIGELEEKAFKAEAKHLEAAVAQTKERVAALDAEASQFRTQAERWVALAKISGAVPPRQAARPAEPEPTPVATEAAPEAGAGDSTVMLPPDAEPQPEAEAKTTMVSPSSIEDIGDRTSVLVRPAEDAPPAAELVCMEGMPAEKRYRLTGDVMTVGRDRGNDVRIENDVKVSRRHCRLARHGTDFFIEDNKSANGVLVNGEEISQTRKLVGGEEIIIGDTPFRFHIVSAGA
ncbi:MAG: FHA domain-containing protein [Candidatus Binatia bacterium]